jgi:hypothetical protein
MHIHFTCSGGYANLRLTYEADTTQLSPALAAELSALVQASGIWELSPADLAAPVPIPDVMTYEVTVQEGDRQITRSLTDLTAPDALRPLLNQLRDWAITPP